MSLKLYEAAKEFVRKVECGQARSVKSYQQFKEAIADYESQRNSPVDDGAGIPCGNQREVQSDSEVQQGNNGQRSGDSDVTKRPSCDGEILRIPWP